jgi:hypothetical protein
VEPTSVLYCNNKIQAKIWSHLLGCHGNKVSNVLLHHGKCLCNNQIASLAQFIDTFFYKEKKCPILFLQLVY